MGEKKAPKFSRVGLVLLKLMSCKGIMFTRDSEQKKPTRANKKANLYLQAQFTFNLNCLHINTQTSLK